MATIGDFDALFARRDWMCESFSFLSRQVVLVLYWSHNEPYHQLEDLEAAEHAGQSSVFVSLSFFRVVSSTALGSITEEWTMLVMWFFVVLLNNL
jgi:hypothetical protein